MILKVNHQLQLLLLGLFRNRREEFGEQYGGVFEKTFETYMHLSKRLCVVLQMYSDVLLK